MEVYWTPQTWSRLAGSEARLEISLGEARLLSDSVNMCFYEAVHTRRLLPAISSLLASHWLVGVTLEPMSDQAEFSSTFRVECPEHAMRHPIMQNRMNPIFSHFLFSPLAATIQHPKTGCFLDLHHYQAESGRLIFLEREPSESHSFPRHW